MTNDAAISDKYGHSQTSFLFIMLLLISIVPNLAQAACSSYKGTVTINEYNYIEHYLELKIIDPAVVANTSTFTGWKLDLYSGTKNKLGTLVSSGYQSTASGVCSAPSNTYLPFKYDPNEIDGTGIVVLKDASGNEVDYFRLSATGSYPTSPASSCSAPPNPSPGFPYPTNGPLNINSGRKGILRLPDGTGNWIIGQGTGNNSEKSPCGSNDNLLNISKTPSTATVGIGSSNPFNWTITVTNGGTNGSLNNVTVTDTLPANMYLLTCPVSATCTGSTGAYTGFSKNIGTLAEKATATITASAYVTVAGNYSNSARATATELGTGYGLGSSTVSAITAPSLHHVRLNHTGLGVTCTGSSITVYACNSVDSAGICTANTTGLSGNVLAKSASGTTIATVPFNIAAGSSSTTVIMPVTTAQTVTFDTSSSASTCWNGTSANCSHIYSNAGFIISNLANGVATTVPPQIAGVNSASYYLRAVKTNTASKACEAALTGTQAVNFAYECNNPSTCAANDLMTLNASTIARNNNGSVSNYAPVSMTFDSNGNAPFSFTYNDVGLIKLYATKAASGTLLTALTGASNAFVVKPDHFAINNIKQTAAPQATNPEAASATDAKFISAGEAFSVTVSAMTATNIPTPSFGKETTAEGVNFTHNLILPSGGASGTLANTNIAGANFNNGVASVNNLAWSEVGIITLSPSIADADYLGAGNVTGTNSVNIGRFIPHHFALTQGTATPACNTFTYFGQDGFSSTGFVLTAQNVTNNTTQNYTGNFAKLDISAWANFGFSAPSLPSGSTLSASTTTPTGSWSNGIATVTATHQASRPTALANETGITIKAAPVDSDGVSLTAADVAPSTPLRYGRVAIQNAFGSELLPLAMPLTAQYWNGSGWVNNTNDNCTNTTLSFAAVGADITNKTCVIEASAANNSGKGCAGTPSNHQFLETGLTGTDSNGVAGFAGNFNLWLKALGAGNTGSLDITASVPNYLRFNWRGTGEVNPTARATFGVYQGNDEVIYFRELY